MHKIKFAVAWQFSSFQSDLSMWNVTQTEWQNIGRLQSSNMASSHGFLMHLWANV